MTEPLARLRNVEVRQAWRHEAHDFTPWLAENLDLLAKVVGRNLVLEASEVAVGGFSADILARDLDDDTWVLIENQLEQTDHTHLGQILTYLAGLDAKTVIWVATDFREPHLSAVQWLNAHTHDDFEFFAIQLRVVQIGDSPLAPQMELIAHPNEWDREVRKEVDSTTGASALTQFRHDFWQAFVAATGETRPAGRGITRRYRVRDVDISLFLAQDRCGIYLVPAQGSEPTDTGDLDLDQATLHNLLGVDKGDNERHFYSQRVYRDTRDRGTWPELIQWLAAKRDDYRAAVEAAST